MSGSARPAFIVFHLTLFGVVLYTSVITLLHAYYALGTGIFSSHLGLIAAVEVLGALLFIIPRTVIIGGIVLLLVFGIAVFTHGIRGELPLLVYAAGVVLVMTHGSAFGK